MHVNQGNTQVMLSGASQCVQKTVPRASCEVVYCTACYLCKKSCHVVHTLHQVINITELMRVADLY